MRRLKGWALGVFAIGFAVACGGSTESDPKGSGGSGGGKGGKGGSGGSTAGQGGFGGVGNAPGGGSGGVPGGTGGAGGTVCDPSCGPSGAPCCDPSIACGSTTMQCECTPELVWQCSGVGATGGTGGCDPNSCGPHGTACCFPGTGCGTAAGGGPAISCSCTSQGIWDCVGGVGGVGGGGVGGGGTCGPTGDCAPGTSCCFGSCVNTMNDPWNCGGCGNACAANPQYCSGGICTKPPCFANEPPPPGTFCCGAFACQQGQLCCDVQGPGPSGGPTCFTPTATGQTCPIGCPLCQ